MRSNSTFSINRGQVRYSEEISYQLWRIERRLYPSYVAYSHRDLQAESGIRVIRGEHTIIIVVVSNKPMAKGKYFARQSTNNASVFN